MNRHHRIKNSLLIGFVAAALSTACVFAADSPDTTAQQHDAAAAAHEKAARHHRAAAQHHRAGEHGIAKAHAKEAEKTSAHADERTRMAASSSNNVKYQTTLSQNGP